GGRGEGDREGRRGRSGGRTRAPMTRRPALLFVAMTTPVRPTPLPLAHEPLWGETPTIFGPRVFHPEIRFGFVRRGSHTDPGDEGENELEQEYGLQYGINRFVNARLRFPVMHTEFSENTAGTTDETLVTVTGDAVLEGKYRFHLCEDTGLQRRQALIVGWKVPTGDDHRVAPDGSRLPPSDQPGSGKHGIEIGWAGDIEHLRDTIWGSVFYGHELGN